MRQKRLGRWGKRMSGGAEKDTEGLHPLLPEAAIWKAQRNPGRF